MVNLGSVLGIKDGEDLGPGMEWPWDLLGKQTKPSKENSVCFLLCDLEDTIELRRSVDSNPGLVADEL